MRRLEILVFCTFQLSGIAVLTVGGIALGSPSTIVNTFYYVPGIDQLEYIVNIQGIAVGPGIYMTCLGSLVIILSFMGCGGVYKKHKGIIGGVSRRITFCRADQ